MGLFAAALMQYFGVRVTASTALLVR